MIQRATYWLRFLLSGAGATAVHWVVMWVMIEAGMPASGATALGASLGALVNYLAQYYHTFSCRTTHAKVIPDYIKVVAVGWMANNLLFYLMFNFLLPNAAWAQLLTTAMVMVLNFVLYKRMVFHDREC